MRVFKHSTEDLAEAAGRTVNTILEWRRKGFFDGIETSKTGGRGQGVRRYWPDEALERVREIVALQAQGYDHAALVKRFKSL